MFKDSKTYNTTLPYLYSGDFIKIVQGISVHMIETSGMSFHLFAKMPKSYLDSWVLFWVTFISFG